MNFLADFPSPLDVHVETLTSEIWVPEDWKKIVKLSHKIGNSQDCKDCLRAIMKRLNTKNPLIVSLALTLTDILSGMTKFGKEFKLQIASYEFETEFRKLLYKSRNRPEIYGKLTYVLKKWAEGDYRSDHQLYIIPNLYESLQIEGHNFSYVFVMHYPWTFKDKYPTGYFIFQNIINDAESELEQIRRGSYSTSLACIMIPHTLKRLKVSSANLKKSINDGSYRDFKVTTDFLGLRKKLSDSIKIYETEIKERLKALECNK